ncbi:uncharacterized protein LOC132267216 [Cornus florida]|uniref:uncharacterized protein LOC132267216 n=1 Tax=Cornus florida TaxID=4283 RepID=UPI00289EF403|nr:uncharacterized protein LOC132267216 [Cornus florida]
MFSLSCLFLADLGQGDSVLHHQRIFRQFTIFSGHGLPEFPESSNLSLGCLFSLLQMQWTKTTAEKRVTGPRQSPYSPREEFSFSFEAKATVSSFTSSSGQSSMDAQGPIDRVVAGLYFSGRELELEHTFDTDFFAQSE